MKRFLLFALIFGGAPLLAQGFANDAGDGALIGLDRYRQPQLQIEGGLGFDNYKLEGQGGSTVDLGNSTYLEYGGTAKWYSKNNNYGILAAYQASRMTFSSPSGVTPANSAATENTQKLAVTTRPFMESGVRGGSMELGLGYAFMQRSAEATSIPLISSEQKSGLFISADYVHRLGRAFHYDAQMALTFLNSFREASPTTGAYQFGYIAEAKFMLNYPIAQALDLSFGLKGAYESIKFYGTGGRGLTGANETQLKYTVPIQLLIFF